MAAPTLGLITLPYPNRFEDTIDIKGEYTQTLDGTRRRAIQAVKHTYILTYSQLTQTQYADIKNEFDLYSTRNFIWDELNIDTTVHIDLSPREFIAGTANLISNITLTLQEL